MPFAEVLKVSLRRRADMRCCLCHKLGVEIHHIVPEEENGPSIEENAAPLCPSCHETYGANPIKRKFVREARDNWYEVCKQRLSESQPGIEKLLQIASAGVTREDLAEFKDTMLAEISRSLRAPSDPAKFKNQPLGKILEFFYTFPIRTSDGKFLREVNFLYDFVWGGSLHDEESDQIKTDFVEIFGTETARHLCAHILREHPLNLKGFTEEELGKIVNLLITGTIMVLHHEELTRSGQRLQLAITQDKQLLGRVVKTPARKPRRK